MGKTVRFLPVVPHRLGRGQLKEDFGGGRQRDPRKIGEEAVLNLKPVR